MLRLALVCIATIVGTYYAFQAPFYALVFYLANAYFRPEDWVYGGVVRSLNLSWAIGLYLVIATLLSGRKFVLRGRAAFLFTFLIAGFASLLLSDYFAFGWPYWFDFAKVVVVAYLIVVLTTDLPKFRLVILTMTLALGLEGAKQGWFYLLRSPGVPNNNPVAFLGDNNGTAIGMLMLVPLIAFLMQTADRRLAKWFYGSLLVGCTYRALSTYSRGGFLAAIAMCATWYLRSHHKLRNLVGVVAILTIILPALPDSFWDRMDTIQTYEEAGEDSALSRIHFWSVALKMAASNPLLGVGFNNFNKAYDSYDFSGGQYGHGRSVHSSLFGVVAEVGYLGLMIYIWILVDAFRGCSRIRRLGSRDATFGQAAGAVEASLVAFVVGGSFVPMQYSEMLWHIMGLSLALQRIALQEKQPRVEHTAKVETVPMNREVVA